MLQVVMYIKMALELLPAVITAVRTVEEALPQSGQGAAKLALIRGVIESAYDNATEAWPMVEKLITLTVNFFNKTGVFAKP